MTTPIWPWLMLVMLMVSCINVHAQPDANKIFRYAFEVAETSMDPHRVSDLYSNIINGSVFDAPLKYDYLARPLKLKPNTLSALPEISADGKTYTLRVKPGIYFSDDIAFKGKKRELVAADYVYSLKRVLDPKLSSPLLSELEGYIVGSVEALANARKANKFDYDAPIEGLRTLDKYTWQIKLAQPNFIFVLNLTDCRMSCAVAREVVEYYSDDVGNHPVGTGAYRLVSWKRASKLVFEPNPNYREEYFDGEPNADDEIGKQITARLKGKRLPQIGRVEVYIVDEEQPRLLAFLNEEHDLLWRLPEAFVNTVIPNNQLAANLKRRDIQVQQVPALDIRYSFFNMDDPIVGGYSADKVALRRAISLAYRINEELAIISKYQGMPADSPYSPGVAGYDSTFKTSANEYSPAKANALLDLYGYDDKNGDGFRELPDGSPLVLKFNSVPIARDKQYDELWKRSMDDIHIRLEVRKAKWPDLLKEAQAGKLMMWFLGNTASIPDADSTLTLLYGPNKGSKGNLSRFSLPAFDRLYEEAHVLPDSPTRTKLYQEMTRLMVAYAPWKFTLHRILTDLSYPWVQNFIRPPVQSQSFWRYLDIDLALQQAMKSK